MRASRAPRLSILALLLVAGCPPTPAPPPGSSPTPTPSASSAAVESGSSPAGAPGTVLVTVHDERGRPVEGAAVWFQGERARTPLPPEPVLLEQRGLEFRPAFLVARKGQTLRVHNADAELHNVHSSSVCCSWNVSVVAGGADSRVLDEAGESTFLCDIHSHMRCVLLVLDADFARTDTEGHARLEAPSGLRKLQVSALDRPRWRAAIEVAAGGVTPVAVELQGEPPHPSVQAPERLPWAVVASRLADSLARAERWASLGDAGSAREAADEALGQWYSASGLYEAVRELDAAQVAQGNAAAKGRADELKSALRKRAARAEAVAGAESSARPQRVAELRAEDAALEAQVGELVRALPRRGLPKGDRP